MPPSLNFFNYSSTRENSKLKSTSAHTSMDKMLPVTVTSRSLVETPKQETCPKNVTKVKPVVPEKKKMPSTIHKSINKLKTASTSTVQALKKKYQEQRLAKQRIENKLKATCVMRTRSCTERATLSTEVKLAPEKFLPRIETKRHGLRSGLLLNKANKSLSKTKVVTVRSKRKVNLKSKNSDTSNTDKSSGEEDDEEANEENESQSEKTTSQIKRNIQKNIQKKICTRSKSEMRRVTRSYSGTISPKNLTTRPTRKTKEAAAVYMEILGRKLVSPELENDDNVSVESFPELPNARRIAQTENEIKAKVKQTTAKTVSKSKDSKGDCLNDNSHKRFVINKTIKLMQLKTKRFVRVQRYCEDEYSDEDDSSVEMNNTRPITRQSLGKLDKPVSRSLRSSSKNTPIQTGEPSNANNKTKAPVRSGTKPVSEKFPMKRKRDTQITPKTPSDKTNVSKSKSLKNDQNKDVESEEETLGMLLSKIKKKKENNEEKEQAPDDINNTKDDTIKQSEAQSTKMDLSKVSDDEESFRGFSKKAISKVLDSCQTHASVNLLVDEKLGYVKMLDIALTDQSASPQEHKEEASPVEANTSVANLSNDECNRISAHQQQLILDSSRKTQDSSSSADKTSKKCNHEDEASPNLMDMPLSTLHARKERVNMSTEQIEKWLNESSLAKEESKLEMENVSTFKYDSTEKLKTDVSHLSIPTKIQHLVRPVNVTLSKLMDKASLKDRLRMLNKNVVPLKSDVATVEAKSPTTVTNKDKIVKEEVVDVKEVVSIKVEKANKDTSSAENNDSVSKLSQNSADSSTEKKSSAEKKIFQPRKPFLPKVKERKTVTPNANAFSPENESSVYAFESDTEVPISTPFRRKVKDTTRALAKSIAKSIENPTEKPIGKPTEKSIEKPITKPAAKPIAKSTAKSIVKSIVTLNPTKPTAVVPAVTSAVTSVAASTSTSTEASTVASAATSTVALTMAPAVIPTVTSTVTSAFNTNVAAEINKPIVKESPNLPSSSEKSTITIADATAMKDQEITAESITVPSTDLNNFKLDLSNIKVLPMNRLTANWSNSSNSSSETSSSIAVQVNFDESKQEQPVGKDERKNDKQENKRGNNKREDDPNKQKSTEISTQTEINNDDEQLFYIPLQAITRSGPNLQRRQVIQGVAVKLGTEGRIGSNQRVLLRAKLVTKSPLSMVRHPTPVGTVQPTTRAPPSSTTTTREEHYVPLASATSSIKVAATTPASVAITSVAETTTPTTVVASTLATATATTPATAAATTPATVAATTPDATVVASTSSTETQLALPAKNDVPVSSSNRPSSSLSNSLDKLRRSPKSSRERKASIDSVKSSKRYILYCIYLQWRSLLFFFLYIILYAIVLRFLDVFGFRGVEKYSISKLVSLHGFASDVLSDIPVHYFRGAT